MRHVIRSAFLVSLPLMVLGCAADSPLGLDENAPPPLLNMGRAPLGMVSGKVTCCNGINFDIQVRRVPNGNVVGVIEWSQRDLRVVERVTCVEIDGNVAWVGTVVTFSSLPSAVPTGAPHTWIFRDGPDALQLDAGFEFGEEPLDCKDKPPVTVFRPDANFVPVTAGDLVISAGT